MATGGAGASPYATIAPALPALALSVPDLMDGQVAVDATCDGADRAPVVVWSGVPEGTRELFLDFYDPDAGDFSHWLVYGLPPNSSRTSPLPRGAMEGVDGFGQAGYGGPCPPRGTVHRYVVRVVAVAEPLGLGPRATRPDLYRALLGKQQLAAGAISARYRRP